MLKPKSIFIVAVIMLLSGNTRAQAPADTLRIDGSGNYPLNEHLYYYQTTRSISPAFLLTGVPSNQFKKLYPEKALSAGFSNYTFWMLFTIKNPLAANNNFVIELNNPNLNNVGFYQKTADGYRTLAVTGTTLPFNSRPYIYYDFVLPVKLAAGQSATYMIMADKKADRFSASPELLSDKTFKNKEEKLYVMMGLLMGIMLFNIVINIFLWLSIKDNIHFLYALYIIAALGWLISSTGLDFQYLFPTHPRFYAISQPMTGGITMVFMAQLAIVFLELRRGRVKLLLNIAKYTVLIQTPFWYIVYYQLPKALWLRQLNSNLFLVAISTIAVCMVAAAIQKIRRGYKPAWFYLAAMIYLAFSIIKTCIIIIGSSDISQIVTPPTDVQIGLIVESIIIFTGIIYRYNLSKKEKETLQAKIYQQQQETTRQIMAAQESERKRIAQDLHDDVGATMSTLLLHVSNIPENNAMLSDEDARIHRDRSITISRKALNDLRLISHDLLPKDFGTAGLFRTLENKIDELNGLGRVSFRLVTSGDDSMIGDIFSITIYRIINELLNNVIKHAMASNCTIELVLSPQNLILIVEDNGMGMDVSGKYNGIGLKNIRSRVDFLKGMLNFDTNANGTTIIVDIPLNMADNEK